MLEDNKALVRRFVDEFQTAGKVEVIDELIAADLTHQSGPAWAHAASAGRDGPSRSSRGSAPPSLTCMPSFTSRSLKATRS